MKYTKQQALIMIKRFNKKDFNGKLDIIKNHKDVIELEYDNGWCLIHFSDYENKDLEDELRDDICLWFDFEGEALVNNEHKLLRYCGIL